MKAPETFTEDIQLMSDMICACDSEYNKIQNEIAQYIEEHNKKYITEDIVGQHFLKKCIELHYGNDLKKTEAAIARLGIALAKAKKIITTTAMEEAIEYAKQRVNIYNVAKHYLGDFNIRRRVKCPFHVSRQGGGKHLQFYEKTNRFHCFSCNSGGNTVDFVMKIENCDFKQAIEILSRF